MGGRGSKSATSGSGRGISAQGLSRDIGANTIGNFDNFLSSFDMYDENGVYDDAWLMRFRDEFYQKGLNTTSEFQAWMHVNDDYGEPEIVSNAELDVLIGEGAQLILRGMPDSARTTGEYKLSQVMTEPEYYAGDGFYGGGLYFSNDIDEAASYASSRSGETGALMRAVLKPGIKTIDYDALRAEIIDAGYNLSHLAQPNFLPQGLVSAFARSRGYDIITIGSSKYNVINRSAIIMADELGRVSKHRVHFNAPVRIGTR